MHFILPMELIKKYQSVIFFSDYMFVKGIPFFNTYTRDISFIASWQQYLKTYLRMQDMKSIKAYCEKRLFNIVKLRHIDLNASVRNDHITEIERINKTIKVRIWSVYTELIKVYGRIPGILWRDLVYALTFWINIFPAKDTVSATLIPQAMITGQCVELTKHCLLGFGEYARTHEDGFKSM